MVYEYGVVDKFKFSFQGAFSGLLAFGISFMKGKGGLEGWSWIFVSFAFNDFSFSLVIQ